MCAPALRFILNSPPSCRSSPPLLVATHRLASRWSPTLCGAHSPPVPLARRRHPPVELHPLGLSLLTATFVACSQTAPRVAFTTTPVAAPPTSARRQMSYAAGRQPKRHTADEKRHTRGEKRHTRVE